MRIVDRDQQRSTIREVHRKPVQPMQHSKRRIERRSPAGRSEQKRPDRSGRTTQQPFSLALPRPYQPPLEQLPHHPERETRLKPRTTRAEDLATHISRTTTCRLHEHRLAKTRPTLHHQARTATRQQPFDRCQLSFALQQALHDNTLSRAAPIDAASPADMVAGQRSLR